MKFQGTQKRLLSYYYRVHFSSPQMHKAMGDLSCAFIPCNVDKFLKLQKTIMIPLEEGRQHLTPSHAIVAYNKGNLHLYQGYLILESVDQAAFKKR